VDLDHPKGDNRTMSLRRLGTGLLASVIAASVLAGCGSSTGNTTPAANNDSANTQSAGTEVKLSGSIAIDGSSTVFPISEAMAEEFQKLHKDVQITVGLSGTGGGFKKFAAGEIDIADASRPQKKEEAEAAKAKGLEAIEIPVAYDGISVVVSAQNDFVDCLTTEELKKIWQPESTVKTWKDVRDSFPAEPIKLYGPGTDSGTFEYFTEAINHKAKASRSDYTASEDDNVLVKGVSGDKYALGYFGYAYYVENKDSLKAIKVDAGKGCIAPEEKTINDRSYALSRPIFIYPAKSALKRPEVYEFVKFYLTEAPKVVGEVGYIALPDAMYKEGLAKVEAAVK
jgi:phosphate transport system substrate-binding protein